MKKVVAVLVTDESGFPTIHSAFNDDKKGNKKAEKIFKELVAPNFDPDHEDTENDIESYMEDGRYESQDYHFSVNLIHFTVEK